MEWQGWLTLAVVTATFFALAREWIAPVVALLVFPIAVAAADRIGADPRAFAIAVAIAASASFLTPIGYQTNMMVYGAGGYRFGDYARLGAPLSLIVAAMLVWRA